MSNWRHHVIKVNAQPTEKDAQIAKNNYLKEHEIDLKVLDDEEKMKLLDLLSLKYDPSGKIVHLKSIEHVLKIWSPFWGEEIDYPVRTDVEVYRLQYHRWGAHTIDEHIEKLNLKGMIDPRRRLERGVSVRRSFRKRKIDIEQPLTLRDVPMLHIKRGKKLFHGTNLQPNDAVTFFPRPGSYFARDVKIGAYFAYHGKVPQKSIGEDLTHWVFAYVVKRDILVANADSVNGAKYIVEKGRIIIAQTTNIFNQVWTKFGEYADAMDTLYGHVEGYHKRRSALAKILYDSFADDYKNEIYEKPYYIVDEWIQKKLINPEEGQSLMVRILTKQYENRKYAVQSALVDKFLLPFVCRYLDGISFLGAQEWEIMLCQPSKFLKRCTKMIGSHEESTWYLYERILFNRWINTRIISVDSFAEEAGINP